MTRSEYKTVHGVATAGTLDDTLSDLGAEGLILRTSLVRRTGHTFPLTYLP